MLGVDGRLPSPPALTQKALLVIMALDNRANTRLIHHPPALAAPRPTEGMEFIGKYEGSGFKESLYLARRADGQFVPTFPTCSTSSP